MIITSMVQILSNTVLSQLTFLPTLPLFPLDTAQNLRKTAIKEYDD